MIWNSVNVAGDTIYNLVVTGGVNASRYLSCRIGSAVFEIK